MLQKLDQQKIGLRIRQIRQHRGMTQHELSERIGMTEKYLSELERGHKTPSVVVLLNLSTVLSVPVDYLLKGACCAADESYIRFLYNELQTEINAALGQCHQKLETIIRTAILPDEN